MASSEMNPESLYSEDPLVRRVEHYNESAESSEGGEMEGESTEECKCNNCPTSLEDGQI